MWKKWAKLIISSRSYCHWKIPYNPQQLNDDRVTWSKSQKSKIMVPAWAASFNQPVTNFWSFSHQVYWLMTIMIKIKRLKKGPRNKQKFNFWGFDRVTPLKTLGTVIIVLMIKNTLVLVRMYFKTLGYQPPLQKHISCKLKMMPLSQAACWRVIKYKS